MQSTEELKLRKLILAEWKAGVEASQAVKNIKKITTANVTSTKVKSWYNRFDAGETPIFNKNSNLHRLRIQGSSVGYAHVTNSLFLSVYDERLDSKMITYDGRIAIFPSFNIRKTKDLMIMDVLNGTKRKLKYNGDLRIKRDDLMAFVDEDNLLVLSRHDWPHNLTLYYVNRENWTLDQKSKIDLSNDFDGKLVLDYHDSQKFAIVARDRFLTDRVLEDQLVLSEIKHLNCGFLHSLKLEGNKLSVFRHMENTRTWQFCEFNLDTLKQQSVDLNIPRRPDGWSEYSPYGPSSWYGNRMYFGRWAQSENKIMTFDADTRTFIEIGISIKGGRIRGMYIDWNGVLTLKLSDWSSNHKFYRFPLFKPDSLKNLAFITMRSHSIIFGSDLYSKVVDRLPSTCELRNQIPNERFNGRRAKNQVVELPDGSSSKPDQDDQEET